MEAQRHANLRREGGKACRESAVDYTPDLFLVTVANAMARNIG